MLTLKICNFLIKSYETGIKFLAKIEKSLGKMQNDKKNAKKNKKSAICIMFLQELPLHICATIFSFVCCTLRPLPPHGTMGGASWTLLEGQRRGCCAGHGLVAQQTSHFRIADTITVLTIANHLCANKTLLIFSSFPTQSATAR